MIQRSLVISGVAFAFALGLGCLEAVDQHDIFAERDGGMVRVRTYPDRQHVEVTSPKGMGAAAVPLARPPRPLQFTFHLRALERLLLTYDDVEIEVAVAADGSVRQSGARGGSAKRELAAGDPLWMAVRIVACGAAASPCIDIDAPQALHDAAPAACRIDWVDFFR